jgi:hypothetical protein
MQIRYFDPQTAGFLPSAFLETVSKTGVSMKLDTGGDKSRTTPYGLNQEETDFVKKTLSQP